ncbi:Sodium/hydrogen exchanger family-domain-containing protein [Lipomyces japonicus]|uniref:Sodium/hydrogen exchanger family-domain-containing protein n=1 Tax=Lipomyces japonicus TaxID=56871 RepID=UPI0034CD4F88
MPTITISNFNLVCALLGGFALVFGLVSYVIKERLYVSEALPSLLFGVLVKATDLIRPQDYNNGQPDGQEQITREFTRLVLGVQLVLAGVQLPARYLRTEWVSMIMLLLPVMSAMWIISGLVIWLCIPNLRYLDALIIGACITPTDPVLSNSIVKGKFAEKHVAKSLRNMISAESGANDGFGYPFLFLALDILHHPNDQIAKSWILETIFYQVILSVAYGAVVGYVAMHALHYARVKNMVDNESFLVFVFALALFVVGTAGLFGTDDLLACFIAGNAFTCDWFRIETEEDSFQAIMDFILNIAMFAWLGAVIGWSEFSTYEIPVWRFIVMAIAILIFRRLPIMLALYKFIPRIENFREAVFAGFFGPIGIGAVFYLHVLRETMDRWSPSDEIKYTIKIASSVVYFLVVSSIIVHGITIPAVKLGPKLPQTLFRSLIQFRTSKINVTSMRTHTSNSIELDSTNLRHRVVHISGPINDRVGHETHLPTPASQSLPRSSSLTSSSSSSAIATREGQSESDIVDIMDSKSSIEWTDAGRQV